MKDTFLRFPALLIFAVSASTILLEMLLIKICNVLLNSTAGFLLLSLALFFLCASGAILYFLTEVKNFAVEKVFSVSAILFCVFASLSLPVLRLISLDTELKISDSFSVSLVILLLMSLPFLTGGISMLILLNRNRGMNFQSLYAADLLGIAGAVFLPRLVISILNPERLMALAIICVASILVISIKGKLIRYKRICLLAILIFNGTLLFGSYQNQLMIPLINKYMPRSITSDKIEYSRWDPIARVDVVDFSNPEMHVGINRQSQSTKYVFYDGGTIGTNIYPYDGNPESVLGHYKEDPLKYFLRLGTVAAHFLKKDTNYKAYLFGVGAGQELKAALVFGAERIYANELVRAVVDLSKDTYAFYNGNIFNSDKVHVLVGDGRLQLKALDEKFDVIQIFSNYLSANMALGLSSFQVSYLFTIESMSEYLERLTDDGILQINQYDHERLLTVLAQAWIQKGHNLQDFKKHIFVIQNQDRRDILPTVLFKKSPFTEIDEAKLRDLFDIDNKADYFFAESPFFLKATKLRGWTQEKLKAVSFAATDDRPFFGSDERLMLNFFGVNEVAYWLLFGSILLLIVIFLGQKVHTSMLKKFRRATFYFSLCGFTFILIQVSLIQMVIKNLNWPDLSFPLVVGGMSLGTALFNILLSRSRKSSMSVSIYVLGGVSVLLSFVMFDILNEVSIFHNVVACLIFFLLFAVIGFTGGSYFSYAVWKLRDGKTGSVLYLAWLFNGVGVLVGSVLMHTLFLNFGHQTVLISSGVLSLVAFFIFKQSLERTVEP